MEIFFQTLVSGLSIHVNLSRLRPTQERSPSQCFIIQKFNFMACVLSVVFHLYIYNKEWSQRKSLPDQDSMFSCLKLQVWSSLIVAFSLLTIFFFLSSSFPCTIYKPSAPSTSNQLAWFIGSTDQTLKLKITILSFIYSSLVEDEEDQPVLAFTFLESKEGAGLGSFSSPRHFILVFFNFLESKGGAILSSLSSSVHLVGHDISKILKCLLHLAAPTHSRHWIRSSVLLASTFLETSRP